MNSALMFSSKKQDWETPSKFFDEINSKYHFSFDLAANIQNAKCQKFYTPLDDSLNQDWEKIKGNMFLNPPYGRDLKKWVKKAAETSLEPNQFLVMLIPARTDTSYWHDYIFGKAEIEFLRGRLMFEADGVPGDRAPFPSALVIYKGESTVGGGNNGKGLL